MEKQGTAGHGREPCLGWSLTQPVVYIDFTKGTAFLLHFLHYPSHINQQDPQSQDKDVDLIRSLIISDGGVQTNTQS